MPSPRKLLSSPFTMHSFPDSPGSLGSPGSPSSTSHICITQNTFAIHELSELSDILPARIKPDHKSDACFLLSSARIRVWDQTIHGGSLWMPNCCTMSSILIY